MSKVDRRAEPRANDRRRAAVPAAAIWIACRAAVLAAAIWIACSGSESVEDNATRPLPESQVTPQQAAEIAALRALGYAEGDEPAPAEALVTLHDPERTWKGYNLYTSEHAPRIFLIDMDGRVLHMWEVRLPDLAELPMLRRARLFENGEVLILMEELGLVRVDRNSEVLWHYPGPCHHDFEISDDGSIYVLTSETAVYPAYSRRHPIRNDMITVLDPDGSLRKEISVIAATKNSACCSHHLDGKIRGNVFHSNALEILDGSLAERHPAFRAGNLLISWRNLDAIGIIDMETERVVWSLGGLFRKQHDPTVLDNGNLLVFDNIDIARGREASRVIEIDPFSGRIHWEFHARPDFPFFTRTGGSSLRLPNGNTLVTETRKGRAFEVTPDREVVWIFLNPARVGEESRNIARIYEMQRLPPDLPLDWIPEATPPADALTARPEPRD
jgi:hypothetical protein